MRYPCDLCDYAATQASSLKKHKESQHERIRHPCDECGFISTTRQGLREHKFRHIKADMQIKQQGKNVVHFLLVDVLTLTIVFCKVTLSQLYEYQPTRLQYLLTFQHIFVISHRKTYFCNLLILKHFFSEQLKTFAKPQLAEVSGTEGQPQSTVSQTASNQVVEALAEKSTVIPSKPGIPVATEPTAPKINKYKCDVCDFSTSKSGYLKEHKEAKHMGIRYFCDLCDYTATYASSLKKHKESKHEGIRFQCDQCDYAATQATNLKKHKEYKHKNIKYPCDLCDFGASSASHLKYHKESKHEGIRYHCDKCSFSATKASNLRSHKESEHEGIRYPCSQCDYSAKTSKYLKKHKETRHGEKKYQCDQCDYTAAVSSYLKRHKEVKHERFRCLYPVVIMNDPISNND